MVRVVERGEIESRRRIAAAGGEEIQELGIGQLPAGQELLCTGVRLGEIRPGRGGLELCNDLARRIASLFGRLRGFYRFNRSPGPGCRRGYRLGFRPHQEHGGNRDDDDDYSAGNERTGIGLAAQASWMATIHILLRSTSRQILLASGRGAHFWSTEILGKRSKTWLIGLVAGVALYTLAGFLVAPRAIKLWIESPNLSGPACRLRVQEVYVNPFTMFLSLQHVTLLDKEDKMFVSAARAETSIWTVGTFRAEKPGRDVAMRRLAVRSADSGGTMLAVPAAFARNVTLGAGGAVLDAAFVRLERPDARVVRDAAGMLRWPAWLSAAGDGRAAACISLDGFEATAGRLRMKDDAVTPSVQLELRDVTATARRKTGRSAAPAEIKLEARIGAAGTVSLEARPGRPAGHHPDLFSLTARNVELQPLSPYFRRIFGTDIVAGVGAATLQQERHDATLRFDNQFSIDGLRLADPDQDSADEQSPLEIAVALATDATGRTEFVVQGSTSDSLTHTVASVFAGSLSAHLDELDGRAFGVLGELAGRPDAVLDEIAFLPGSAEMAPVATDALALLALALGQRPQLGMRVRPAYDLEADRAAIAAQQVKLHIALATSKSTRERGDTSEPDFDDPRVRDVLDEFAGARLSETQRRVITGNVRDKATAYRDIYLALIDKERVSETVLRRLARFRARSVIDALERAGIDRQRLRMADVLDTAATDAPTVTLKLEAETHRVAPSSGAHSSEIGSDGG